MDWGKGAHASTFGGNPVCIASALKTIELLENGMVENAATVGDFLQSGLRQLAAKYECVGDVRGLGLMIGVEFVENTTTMKPAPELRDRVEMECFNRGLIILGCGTSTIRFSPPLILSQENATIALEIFDAAIAASI
jgi:4-aminobutyrate aminotransferase